MKMNKALGVVGLVVGMILVSGCWGKKDKQYQVPRATGSTVPKGAYSAESAGSEPLPVFWRRSQPEEGDEVPNPHPRKKLPPPSNDL
jgi:hypothetical protein